MTKRVTGDSFASALVPFFLSFTNIFKILCAAASEGIFSFLMQVLHFSCNFSANPRLAYWCLFFLLSSLSSPATSMHTFTHLRVVLFLHIVSFCGHFETEPTIQREIYVTELRICGLWPSGW